MIAQISAQQTWEALQDAPDAVLVDVRTPMEWQQVGLPDLASLGRPVATLTWQPGTEAAFAAALTQAVPARETPHYFICRSGARSQSASLLAEHLGYAHVHNVADGFEGPPDETGQRGRVMGWQAAGLPSRTPSTGT